jgi:predicted DNA-binding transcriptional regulator YafY
MLRLHRLLETGKFPNCRTLAAELEVSSKTIQRDIDFLRDRMGLPIAYDQLKFGFRYTAPVTHFPTLEISEGEVAALFIAQKALAQHHGTPFEKPLRAACRKIAESLPGTISVNLPELDAAISFRSAGVSGIDLALFEAVSRAVLQSLEMTFHYQKLRSRQIEVRRAQPYHLGCVENQWYLFAHDLDRGQLRTFALPRMRQVRVSGVTFARPAGFSISQHLGESFGVFKNAKNARQYRVRIRFDEWAARLVSERVWHGSQKTRPLPGGEIELMLRLGGLEEIERWVLSWGAHARVITPQRLRTRIKRTAALVAAF